ncbi:MAG: cupin domain-containing protein [Polyangiales bacterium]
MLATKVIHRLNRAVQQANIVVHGRGNGPVAASLPKEGEPMPDLPIPREWILEGNPVATGRVLTISGDGGMVIGTWECTAGRFHWIFDSDEFVQILGGEVHVEHEGKKLRLVEGDVALFPIGSRTIWHVPERVRKTFVHRHPSPIMRELLTIEG